MDIPKIMLKFVNSHISVTIATSFVYFWIFLFCKSDVYALMPLFVSWLCCETWFVAMMELCWFPKRFSYRKTSGVSFLARLQDQSLTWFFVGFSTKILSRTVCDGGLLWFRKFLRDRKRPPFPTLQSTYLQRQQLTCKARLLWELWTWEKTFMIQCLTGSWNLSQNLITIIASSLRHNLQPKTEPHPKPHTASHKLSSPATDIFTAKTTAISNLHD